MGGSPWQEGLPGRGSPCGCLPGRPPVNRMTDACENIALPQTSFAGGNNAPILNLLTLVSSEGRSGSVDDDR